MKRRSYGHKGLYSRRLRLGVSISWSRDPECGYFTFIEYEVRGWEFLISKNWR